MRYIVNHLEMKAIDGYTIQKVGIPSIVLMEKAAMSAVAVMMERLGRNDRVLAVCGAGNNGGDGIAMARILKISGFQVDILFLGEEGKATEETLRQIRIAKNVGVKVKSKADIWEYDVVVDAIFGIGLSKEVTGAFAEIIEAINQARFRKRCLVYSVDVPSGIRADDGRVMKTAVRADCTITFGFGKWGLVLYPGCEYGGKIVVADIGYPYESIKAAGLHAFVYEKEDIRRLLPHREGRSNKGNYGRVLVVAGTKNMSGACYFSAKAAYRSGAGLVKIATVEDNRAILQMELPEAILSTYDSKELGREEENALLQDIAWASVIAIGPGMGTSSVAGRILDLVLTHANVPVVVDADAVNILSKRKEVILGGNVILTPHVKEMARLCRCQVSDITDDPVAFVKQFMDGKDFTLVLKDARTLVAKEGRLYVNVSGNHGMATGGSGDVLTGLVAGLAAGGKEPFEAATLGAYLHGLAGDYVSGEKNPYSLMAGDLVEALFKVIPNESQSYKRKDA